VTINEMMMLSQVLDKYTKLIRFNIYLNHITMPFCKELKALADKHKGRVPLEAQIIDLEHNLTLTMKTRDMRVDPREFLPILSSLPNVSDVKPIMLKD
jgi:hypothetical protein